MSLVHPRGGFVQQLFSARGTRLVIALGGVALGVSLFCSSSAYAAPKLTAKKYCAAEVTKSCKKKRCTTRIRTKLSKSCLTKEDVDGDNIRARYDNCKTVANPDQRDTDKDGVGNACDNAPLVSNREQSDADGDKIGDVIDNCPSVANVGQVESDGDGIGDACDICPGADERVDGNGDGIKDCLVKAARIIAAEPLNSIQSVSTNPRVSLLDGSLHIWDIAKDGAVFNGGNSQSLTRDVFDEFAGISFDNVAFPDQNSAGIEDGREVVLGPVLHFGLTVTRKIYVSPNQGFSRWLDIVENKNSTPISRTIKVSGYLSSAETSNAVYSSSSGDSEVDPADTWWSSCPTQSETCVAQFSCGGAFVKTGNFVTLNYGSRIFAPNSRIIFMSVLSQDSPATTLGETTASAAGRVSASISRWTSFPRVADPELLAGMSSSELNDISTCGGAIAVTGRPGVFAAGQTIYVRNLTTLAEVNTTAGNDGAWAVQIRGGAGDLISFSSGPAAPGTATIGGQLTVP